MTRPDLTQPVLEELEEYHRAYNLWDAVPPEVTLLLDRLRRRYRLGVISNANGTVRDKLQRAGLAPYFDVIIDSHEERVEKPDPRIFRLAMDRAWALPHRSVHVGDMSHVDLVGARAAGMRAILLDPAGIHADKPAVRITSLEALVPHLV